MKKLLTALLSLCITDACAEDEPPPYTSKSYKYLLLADGTAKITAYTGKIKKLTVPETLDGHAVTAIGDNAFSGCMSLTSVVIPDSVTDIGDSAFYHCMSLKSVTIGNGVTTIGDEAFFGCDKLTSIVIPDSVTSIGANPFEDCTALTDIRVSSEHPTLAVIDGVLFDKTEKKLICYPSALTADSYTIPQDIQVIGDSAFSRCSLTSITIPDSVTTIGDSAFSDCDALKTITVTRDSFAEQYCKDKGLPYAYPDANDWLTN